MHPKNFHNNPYPMDALVEAHPQLKDFVFQNTYGSTTINFSDADAIFHLNKAILIHFYQVSDWTIPYGYLCPPIPSRADYIHYLNDLLTTVSIQSTINVLDIGTGANCIYPIVANALYGWTAVGCDIDLTAVNAAKKNIAATQKLSEAIEIRHQTSNANIFSGIIQPGEFYHATLCNPPFYKSAEDANRNTMRKLKQLHPEKSILELERNFEGQPNELWCNGGEALFIKRMIKQSIAFKEQVGWFTTLVSRNEHLEKIYKQLNKLGVQHETLQMKHGSKTTRVVAWSYL